MQADVLIIGGGMSGLSATWQLRLAGVDAMLLEARPRFGGRILTVGRDDGTDCDLGPSWFWPEQPLLASLLNHFEIPFYEQYADGGTLFQQPDGELVNAMPTSPMAGALRIEGGINRLTDALANGIDESARLTQHVVTQLSAAQAGITVDAIGPAGPVQIQAKQVAVAIPPRLAAGLTYMPELPAPAMQALSATPTWMAGHAKFFAIYDEPFWRKKGLCGSAISRRGPLAEIHDASPQSGDAFCLFGFVGVEAERRMQMGREALIDQATAQLVDIFGAEAGQPQQVHLQDWSAEEFTAGAGDSRPPTHHPNYGLDLQLGGAWEGKLDFISAETSYGNGGLIEGALEAGLKFAKRITAPDRQMD